MTEPIRLTDQAVITAARALIMENERCAAKLKDGSLSDEQAEYFGDYVQLLDAAMGEIEALYVERQAANRHMGSFDALYESVSLDKD
ncbi:MAG: hypothetical protein M3N82_02330 [Pseudomonadota bacterium]|nr:hypothetical protein [Pseudomonadota bacterium]